MRFTCTHGCGYFVENGTHFSRKYMEKRLRADLPPPARERKKPGFLDFSVLYIKLK